MSEVSELQPISEAKAAAIERTRVNALGVLLAERSQDPARAGAWVGELSSSALSTATAVAALSLVHAARPSEDLAGRIAAGLDWLRVHANDDGGHGDTTDSPSNLSTTVLVWMAHHAANRSQDTTSRLAAAWITNKLGPLEAGNLVRGLEAVYGDDRTFAVPILTACAAAGCCEDLWPRIPPLPFELAALPRGLFRFLGLPVVSYALPALIAIGQVLHRRAPSQNPVARRLRALTAPKTLRTLTAIQPPGGGYLEATPLTSFVLISLSAAGQLHHPVVARGLGFLCRSQRPDGAWPIDTDLSTWGTTLSIQALAAGSNLAQHLDSEQQSALIDRLLSLQQSRVHPYTGAAPGGWAWTDQPGGVPDADDTAGALIALRALCPQTDPPPAVVESARRGIAWLLNLANRDGGTPTFCRGWGKLPFDQSSADLTAHTLRAYGAWSHVLDPKQARAVTRASRRARAYLTRTQRSDGAWVPLWFGDQAVPSGENPLYGTARVLLSGHLAPDDSTWRQAQARALTWLLTCQAPSGSSTGGFGAAPGLPPSIEETALALEALNAARHWHPNLHQPLRAAATWLSQATRQGTHFPPRPMGLYFASLWYSERLYPLVFTVAALNGWVPEGESD